MDAQPTEPPRRPPASVLNHSAYCFHTEVFSSLVWKREELRSPQYRNDSLSIPAVGHYAIRKKQEADVFVLHAMMVTADCWMERATEKYMYLIN